MQILHVIPTVAPRYGGPSTAVAALAATLARTPGVSCEVVATDADGPGGRFDPAGWSAPGVPLHLFPVEGSVRWGQSPALASWLDREAVRFDVICSHAAWAFSTVVARQSATRHGRPLVYMPHGMLSRYTWTRNRPLKWAYWLRYERANVAAAAAIHTTSAEEAAELADYRTITAPVAVIPLGVDDDSWTAPARPEVLRELCGRPPDHPPILLFLSRLHPKKGVADVLIPAFARMTVPAILAIAGGVDDSVPEYGDEVRKVAAALGVADRVRFLGRVAPADRWSVFDGADAFVLPSYQENFGIAVAEALARGVPVVVSDRVQIAPDLAAAGCARVVPLDPGAVAAALDALLADPAGRLRLGAAGRAFAAEHYTWDAVTRRVLNLYDSVTRNRKPAAG
ncbi:MAG: glycosyltransferase [Fimbriiglobus sp.]